MDANQWPQGIGVVHQQQVNKGGIIEGGGGGGGAGAGALNSKSGSYERKAIIRPQKEAALNCPRCNSTNTKFCYYNNYSLSQPRYFCGTLRNVPVGGGSRKNKHTTSRSSSSSSNPHLKKLNPDLTHNPNKIIPHQPHHDLNLAYNPVPPPPKSLFNFSLDGSGVENNGNYGISVQDNQPVVLHIRGGGDDAAAGRSLFLPYEELNLKTDHHEIEDQRRNKGESTTTGYCWNGMLGGAAGSTW
ncbi:hypothetical protein M9H77_26407 [Catharanthus roseus]|uniref:Uncharacterized protein n=1 Tax=Catharanthus roseus TaxID=4058 RepID=A0ACC0ABS2_CATRO|nr:hypothetical protein M9H77_26407 [Catharanthus roseus]